MSTTYLLHGGNAREVNPDNDLFFQEIIQVNPDAINVLLVQFEDDPNKQSQYEREHITQFERNKGERVLKYKVSTHEDFPKQLNWADIIYLGGTSMGTKKLLLALKMHPDFLDMVGGKVIAGESAGANILSSYCYSKSSGNLQCLGILPIVLVPHYQPEYRKYVENLEPGLKHLYLKNYAFVKIIN